MTPSNNIPHHQPATGAAMDTIVPRRRGKAIALAALAIAAAIATLAMLWQQMPRGLQVAAADLRIASVERGVFRDDVAVRASAEPLRSVMLDSVESGRVEEIAARDGDIVAQGQLLFRIANPQRHLELLARQAEHAQQISNLSNLRVAQEAAASDHQRRLDDLLFALQQAEKQHARTTRLAAQGYVSAAALEESADRVAHQRQALAQARDAGATEGKVRAHALAQLGTAIDGLRSGLKLVGATVEALAVRAPAAGRLTDFRLQVGESIAAGKHVGRIDDPQRFKLTAQVDEFYLARMAAGRAAQVRINEQSHGAQVTKVYPQIRDGRFTLELEFSGDQQPALNPGQGVDVRITLGDPAPAMLLPYGAWAADSGGLWAYVVAADGGSAQLREIRPGRRNHSQVEVLAGLAPGEKVIVSGYANYGKSPALHISR
jgi:HlyD family secretion protein